MQGVQYIPTRERNRMMSGPASSLAMIGLSVSAIACAGMCLSAALRLFGGFHWAPLLGEAPQSASAAASVPVPQVSTTWLAVWNFGLPSTILALTAIVLRGWKVRAANEQTS